jgi:hypothetical protein
LLPIKNLSFHDKLEHWETCIHFSELDRVPTPKDLFDGIIGDIYKGFVLVLYNEMCQYLEDLKNPVNQCLQMVKVLI